ncbi:hypothetical protein BT63DRAFT_483765 [Microthyrium microscopicum]|uniref:Integral membrane protein n=1 Tax=Microthyrium microscopicum TaxID=703497 RepID=A0A6A6TX10_9PEZI|nr:hypothetical protein BT63DRAFT_483765 [Microthyrium microscopicum]
MGKIGRIACIATPMALSVASFICLLVVFMGGLNKGDSNLRGLYYFKADTSQFKANSTAAGFLNGVQGISADTKQLIEGLIGQAQNNNLKDEYYIYLENFCTGSTNGTIDYCSPRQSSFYFNPINEWGLNSTLYEKYIPSGVNTALNTYKKVASWMFIAYVIAFWTTIASIVVGLLAICSRIGSCLTTIVASVATLFTLLAALTSTILFSTLVGALDGLLKPYSIKLSVGTRMMALDWIAVAFSIGASMFWLVSICCCSGRSDRKERRRKAADPEPGAGYAAFGSQRGYKPLEDDQHHNQPYHNQYGAQPHHTGHEMQEFGTTHGAAGGPYKGRDNTAYEPFRQT